MTLEIALVLAVFGGALVLFVTGWVRMDVTALLVLSTLAVTGLVTPSEAVAGFSNSAVITIWAMYILGEGLTRAGIADLAGRGLMPMVGRSESRAVAALMIPTAFLSAFMNNIGVAVLMLPVAVAMARRTGIGAARLLMPLAAATHLGGMTTLIGTSPNLIVDTTLREAGLEPLGVFDFAPLGGVVTFVGIAFVALVGRRLLPRTSPLEESRRGLDLRSQYKLAERIFALRVPKDSALAGKRLSESGLTSAAGLIAIALTREGRTEPLPDHGRELRAGDLLLVQGRLERFDALRRWSRLVIERETPMLQGLLAQRFPLRELRVAPGSSLIGQSLRRSGFRQKFGCIVLGVLRDGELRRTRLAECELAAGDRLLVQCGEDSLEALSRASELDGVAEVGARELAQTWQLAERLFAVRVPTDAGLTGVTLAESRLADTFDFRLLAISRGGELLAMPGPAFEIQDGDLLLVQGRSEDLDLLRGLQQLEIVRDATPYLGVFEQGELELVEAVLHPHSKLAGRSIGELNLRKGRRIELAAVWRAGHPHRSGLGSMLLEHGDALLFIGPREQLATLSDNPDLIVLNPIHAPAIQLRKAPLAGGILVAMVVVVLAGLLPVSIAAITAATAMVVTGCLTMEQAHRAIEWRAIFLIAGMLPLGVALETSGAARLLAEGIVLGLGVHGPLVVMMALYAATAAATMVVPNSALIVLVAPIALTVARDLDASPHAFLIAVACATAASFASPVSHAANLLVMGPGGYRFSDYLKLGLPLTLIVMLVVALVLPSLWPLA